MLMLLVTCLSALLTKTRMAMASTTMPSPPVPTSQIRQYQRRRSSPTRPAPTRLAVYNCDSPNRKSSINRRLHEKISALPRRAHSTQSGRTATHAGPAECSTSCVCRRYSRNLRSASICGCSRRQATIRAIRDDIGIIAVLSAFARGLMKILPIFR